MAIALPSLSPLWRNSLRIWLSTTLVIGIKLGWRQALLAVGSLAVLTIPAALSQGDPAAGTVVMTLTALALGLSARWQLQPVYWLMVVSPAREFFHA